jgi:hypothetical protein
MLSGNEIDVLLSIARVGDNYDELKRLLATTGWEIDEDDTDLGFLRIFIPDPTDKCYRLIIGYRDPDRPPYSLLTFSLFPDSQAHIAAFNSAFHSIAEFLKQYLGAPSTSGDHRLSFRAWSYAYQRWSLPEGEFTLVQDEFDIQDGMDITLWIQPVGTPLAETLHL